MILIIFVPIYVSKPLKHKDNHVIFSFVPYCILAFLMILSLSLLYIAWLSCWIEYYLLFGFYRNLWEFCAIIQSSLRASVSCTHRCDEESVLWRNAGGSLSLTIKEFGWLYVSGIILWRFYKGWLVDTRLIPCCKDQVILNLFKSFSVVEYSLDYNVDYVQYPFMNCKFMVLCVLNMWHLDQDFYE